MDIPRKGFFLPPESQCLHQAKEGRKIYKESTENHFLQVKGMADRVSFRTLVSGKQVVATRKRHSKEYYKRKKEKCANPGSLPPMSEMAVEVAGTSHTGYTKVLVCKS